MSETNGTNGSNGNKLLWWIIGGLITPFILSSINTISGDSKRVAGIEAIIQELSHRLERMETKLERILERK